MARKKTPTLTEAELRIMDVIWDLGQATVSDVVAKLPSKGRLAYNTVLTTVRILEQKNYLKHGKEGRAHVYQPLVSRQLARRKAVRHMVSSFFNGSPEALMLSILQDENLTPEEADRLKKMIEPHKQV
jgi:predicted transcriptional regulator